MTVRIRLARGGTKKKPHYSIVVANSRAPRDGSFVEKLGYYSPLQPKDSDRRIKIDGERVLYWLSVGAQPTDRVARILEGLGTLPKKQRNNPKKAIPKKAAE